MSGNRLPPAALGLAPALALGPAVALVWWAFPHGLPLWRGAAIVSAWAGTGLLVSSLVLMARAPRFARLLGGLEAAYRWHHRSGLLAYLFLLVHPLALAAEGWAESPHVAWEALAPWTQPWPVWLGWGGLLLLMAGLAGTFAMRLPYRRWRGLHFMLGLGALAGLGHAYVLLGDPRPILALLLAAVLALAWRVLAGDLGLAAHPYRVTAVANRAAGMIEASLAPCAGALALRPGQFVLAAFGEGPRYHGCGEFHPFTVSGVAADDTLRVGIKALGPCSRRLQDLEPGVMVRLQGPFGDFLGHCRPVPQLWIAGGIGITPFVAALRAGPRAQPTTLVYLHRNTTDGAFGEELVQLAAADPRLEIVTVVGGEQPPDLDTLLARVNRLVEREVHLCGPPPLVDALIPLLRDRGVAADAIHFERFDFR